ncbi:hypothetical protein JCM6882_003178 [Rhodosporidiobolus microsporus]
MSRYANRFSSAGGPPPSSGYHRSEDYFLGDEGRGGYGGGGGGGGGRRGGGGYDDEDGGDEDDDTAVATDLSALPPHAPRRGVSFGQNEVEEFNGSEAPEAIIPARSNSRMGHRASPAPQQHHQQQQQLLPPGIGRPRSTSMDGRRTLPPPPQPPTYDSRYGRQMPPPASFDRDRDRDRDRGYGRQPVSFARGGAGGYGDDDEEFRGPGDDGYDDDDDDAFTAVATGVATELDFDADDQRRRQQLLMQQQRYGFAASGSVDPRDRETGRYDALQAIQRPPSRGVQVYRNQSPVPPSLPPLPPTSHGRFASNGGSGGGGPRTASGYQASDFSAEGDDDDLMPPPPLPPSRRNASGSGFLSPPVPSGRALARPASTGSMRMLIDEDGEGGLPGYGNGGGGGIGRQQTPRSLLREQQLQQQQMQQQQQQQQALARVRQQEEEEEGGEDSPVEKELIALLKELRFSIALKDFHDTMRIGVQKTLVAEDGMGHAYCKVHCKKLPRHEAIAKEDHLKQHWIPIAGSRWEFRTASHRVTVVFKTAALAAYEAQFLTSGGSGRR